MKIKILLLLSILISLFIIIPSTFAADVNDTNVVSDVDNDVLKDYSDLYFNSSVSSDGDGSYENPYKTISYSRIKNNYNLHFADGEYSLNYAKQIKNISFYGQNPSNTIINGNGLTFETYDNIYFENITLKNFVFENYNNIEANNSIFISSSGYDYGAGASGGVISSLGGYVKLTDCILKDNAAEKGGAVYIENGVLEIINSDFINNVASYAGGAIYVSNSSVTINNSRFNNCRASNNAAGGIYLFKSNLTVSNSNFTGLNASFGSAITALNNLTYIVLNGIRCENNSAVYEGGAIYVMYGTLNITNSYFYNNTARNGGALFIDNLTQADISSNSFIKNNARNYAGAIYSLFNSATLNNNARYDNTFQNNNAENEDDMYNSTTINLVISNGNYTMYLNNITFDGSIPTQYSLVDEGYVTPVKNQQDGGNCWAFSAIAALESCILKAGGNITDFSENNMKNIITLFSDYGKLNDVNEGGNFYMALAYLASWLGPVSDENDIYDGESALSTIFNSTMHVQNAIFLKRTSYTDNDEIKKAILKYGAVSTSMMYDDWFLVDTTNYYYYCDYPYTSNHAVTVVGWDDSIEINGYTGAWLVRNSWGSSWGNDGYFYVSYYDETMFELNTIDGYTYILNDTIPYDKNYQHETTGYSGTYYPVYNNYTYKNIYYSTEDEYLAAVSTYFLKAYNWTVEIKVNDVLMLTQSGEVSQIGYYTIKLDKFLKLTEGDKFEVNFGLNSQDGSVMIPVTSSKKSTRDFNYQPEISYYTYLNNWGKRVSYDLYNGGCVACIKAFTFIDEIKTNNNLTITVNGNSINITSKIIDEYGNLVNIGNVTFNINGVNSTTDILNGIASTTATFNSEENSISSIFNGLGYVTSYNSTLFTRTTINADDMLTVYGNNDQYNISLADIYGGNVSNRKVKFTLSNGQTYETVTDSNGYASFLIDLDVDTYTLTVSYAGFGSDDYDYEVVKEIIVNKKSLTVEITSNVNKDNATISITADDINDDVTLTVDGVNEDKIITDGQLSFDLYNLSYGSHNITVTSKNNYNFSNNEYTFNIVIKRTKISAENIVVYFDKNTFYTVQLIDVDGVGVEDKEIVFNDGTNTYKNITDENGIASIPINLSGIHDFTITFAGDDYYFDSSNSSELEVKTTIIKPDYDTFPLNSTYNVVFLNGDGDPLTSTQVTIVLDDNSLIKTTNSLGNASISLGTVVGNHTIKLSNPATGEVTSHNIKLEMLTDLKTTITLTIIPSNGGDSFTIQADVVDEYGNLVNTGIVTFDINNNITNQSVENGQASVINSLNKEYISINATFNGENYNSSSVLDEFVRTSLTSNDLTFDYGDVNQYSVTLSDLYGGDVANRKVTFVVDGKPTNVYTNEEGVATLAIDLGVGTHEVSVVYEGYDGLSVESETVRYITVSTKLINIQITSTIDRNKAYITIIADNINVDVNIFVDSENQSGKIQNGTLTLELSDLDYGSHELIVQSNNDNYSLQNNTYSFNINVKKTVIIADNLETYSKNPLYTIQLVDQFNSPLSDMEVSFTIGGEVYKNSTDSNGFTSLSLNLTSGSYSLFINFEDSEEYIASNETVEIVIKSSVVIENKTYTDKFSITLVDNDGNIIANQNVTITINGVDYETTTDDNGVASVALNLANGKYTVTITNPVTGEVITQVIEIAKKSTVYNWISQNKNVVMYYGANKYYTVRVCDDNGKYVSGIKVTFVLNGKTYVVSSKSNGYASIKLSLKPGKYTIYAKYHGKTVSNKITVKQTLTAKNIKVKKGKTIKFKAKLVNTNGKALKNKKLVFKFKGKKYKAKTNKKGIATLKLKLKLKVGKYTIKTSYGKNSIKNTIKIKK